MELYSKSMKPGTEIWIGYERNTAAEAVIEAARELIEKGLRGTFDGNGRPILAVVERVDNSDPHVRLCNALAALDQQGGRGA